MQIIIVGAGIGGLSAALSLALAGHKVRGTIQTDKSLPFNPLAEVQIGAVCAP